MALALLDAAKLSAPQTVFPRIDGQALLRKSDVNRSDWTMAKSTVPSFSSVRFCCEPSVGSTTQRGPSAM
ncbi:MAG: hypothetical protein HWD60_09300 [Defluviicoccus sp.]|nr:MAG: hypothetical protein HWD60_09300 [Defluviicoccus sp.]